MAEATGTITNFDGNTISKKAVEIVGTYGPFVMLKYVPSTADDTAGTVGITIPNLKTIIGWVVSVCESGVLDANNDITITSSGNVLTIADGSNWTIAATSVVYLIVWGKPAV